MTATLRVMLDQLVAPTEPDLVEASRDLTRALVIGAPAGCEVEGIAPAGGEGELSTVTGLVDVRRTALQRRALAGALQLGVGTGIGGGMIHSPSLFAPLVRHDRVHDNDQTVVTVWDLRPWETPAEMPRSVVAWHRAIDTALPAPRDIAPPEQQERIDGPRYAVAPRTVVVLESWRT